MRKSLILALAAVALAAAPAMADSLQDGARYFQHADYNRALASWRPLAVQGNPVAQNNLGIMYLDGKGVPQNTSEAVRYLSCGVVTGVLVVLLGKHLRVLGVLSVEEKTVADDLPALHVEISESNHCCGGWRNGPLLDVHFGWNAWDHLRQ